MDDAFWAKAHGATTHFPFALALASLGLDGLGLLVRRRPAAAGLQAAGFWSVALAALACPVAVFTGLRMTRGSLLGHGALRLHHLFVWPAFLLLTGLGLWRVLVRPEAGSRPFLVYLAGIAVLAGLMTAAAYWGGEMMIRA